MSGTLPNEMPAQWLTAIGNMFDTKLAPALQRLDRVESTAQQAREEVSALRGRVDKLEHGGTSSATWVPTYVEIKGFCQFDKMKTEGCDKPTGVQLVMNLKNMLDARLYYECLLNGILLDYKNASYVYSPAFWLLILHGGLGVSCLFYIRSAPDFE